MPNCLEASRVKTKNGSGRFDVETLPYHTEVKAAKASEHKVIERRKTILPFLSVFSFFGGGKGRPVQQ